MVKNFQSLSLDDRTFVRELDSRFHGKGILANAKCYGYIPRSPLRLLRAFHDAATIQRSGYIRRNFPEDVWQPLSNHLAFTGLLSSALAPDGIDQVSTKLEGQIHDIPVVIASDFTPHDLISKPDRMRIEDIAARIIFNDDHYRLWVRHETGQGFQEQWVRDCDALEMPLHCLMVEQRHPGLAEKTQEFFDYVERTVRTPRGKDVFGAFQGSRKHLHEHGCTLGFRAATKSHGGVAPTNEQIKIAEIYQVSQLLGISERLGFGTRL